MLPDLVSLSLFLRAVEAHSLSKAAAQSHLALAAASRRIAQLEHCYGVQLLYRSAQGVEPTPASCSREPNYRDCKASTTAAVAVVPRGHPLRQRTARFAELIQHDFVGLDSGAAMMRLVADAAAALRQPLRLRVQVSSFEAVCTLVQTGMGIGVLPEGAAPRAAGGAGP